MPLSLAGLFVPQTYADPTAPPGILADAVDPVTGEYLSISRGWDPIDEQLIAALTLERGTGAAAEDDGQDFFRIEKMTEAAAQLIDAEGRRALKRLLDNGDIAIRSILVVADPSDDFAEIDVRYQNVRARGQRDRVATVVPVLP